MRHEISFQSGGERCAAWLYQAGEPGQPRPVVVMAHGLGGTRSMRLPAYAERFRAVGYHVLVFDYRHFGESAGTPRQLLAIEKQLTDWASALELVRSLPEVDAARVVLWGTSLSGGHVLVAAARDSGVAAVIAQCPMVDGLAAAIRGLTYAGGRAFAEAVRAGLRDASSRLRQRPPELVPIVGPPGSMALMTTPDAEPGYRAIAGGEFRNEVLARFVLEIPRYRPIRAARELHCPVLLQICDHDSVAPPRSVEALARRLGSRASVVRYPIGHFDVYLGSAFERAVSDQIDFLASVLGNSPRR